MADGELDWDHAADFGERNPLLEGSKVGHSTFYRSSNLALTYDDARELINILETSRLKLQDYVEYIEDSPSVDIVDRPGRCLRLRKEICPKIVRNIIVITIILQAVNLLILSLIDIWPKKDDETVVVVSAVTMIIVQLLNLFCLIFTSVELAKQLYKRNVSNMLLAQSYLATILLFNGIYILTYRLKPESWKFIQENLNKNPDLVIVLYVKLLFFSVSTATLCGTANVLPNEWYNYIFTSFQMLLSFVYFTSILGQSIAGQKKYTFSSNSSTRRHINNYGATTSDARNILSSTLDTSLPGNSPESSIIMNQHQFTGLSDTTRRSSAGVN